MTKLITEVKPENLVTYGKLLVAFFDGFKDKKIDSYGNITLSDKSEPELYIHIQNSDDKYSVLRRKAGERVNKIGRRADEKLLFKSAYEKYLAAKNEKNSIDLEKESLKARIAELEAKATKVAPKVKKVQVQQEIKEEINE